MKSQHPFVLILLTPFLLAAEISFACEFHGGYGFGVPNHGKYQPWQASYNSVQTPTSNAVKLKVPVMVKAKAGDAVELNIDYEQEPQVKYLRLTISATPEISAIETPETSISDSNGSYQVSLTPSDQGTYKLQVTATFEEDGETVATHETIYLYVAQKSI